MVIISNRSIATRVYIATELILTLDDACMCSMQFGTVLGPKTRISCHLPSFVPEEHDRDLLQKRKGAAVHRILYCTHACMYLYSLFFLLSAHCPLPAIARSSKGRLLLHAWLLTPCMHACEWPLYVAGQHLLSLLEMDHLRSPSIQPSALANVVCLYLLAWMDRAAMGSSNLSVAKPAREAGVAPVTD